MGYSGGQCAMVKPLLENIGGSLVRHTCMYVACAKECNSTTVVLS